MEIKLKEHPRKSAQRKNIKIRNAKDQAATAAKSLQSCLTLCDPIDGSPPGCPVPGILQARTLEWVAISFSNAWKWKVKVKLLSHVRLLATPWTAAYQVTLSMGFSRQEYWSGVPLPSPKGSRGRDKYKSNRCLKNRIQRNYRSPDLMWERYTSRSLYELSFFFFLF